MLSDFIKLKKRWERKLHADKVSYRAKFSLFISLAILISYFSVESLIIFKFIEPNYYFSLYGYLCALFYVPNFLFFIKEVLVAINSQKIDLSDEVLKKNTYLEHATKILRHDMHSGINTYIPRGLSSLERRLPKSAIKKYKLKVPLKLLKEGLAHSQQVYKGIYEFTNLVRDDSALCTSKVNLKEILELYLKRTAYKDQVLIEDLPNIYVNESLFCTAIDNLIRNGLKYNDSQTKWVKIKMINKTTLAVIDNGRGMCQDQFEKMRQPYVRRERQKESGSGLGLNICVAILKEHGFKISSKKLEKGTMITIDIINEHSINNGALT